MYLPPEIGIVRLSHKTSMLGAGKHAVSTMLHTVAVSLSTCCSVTVNLLTGEQKQAYKLMGIDSVMRLTLHQLAIIC